MKVYKNSEYLLEDMVNELDIKKDLYNSVTKGNKALRSAMKIFNGDPEKKLMVEQSMCTRTTRCSSTGPYART